MDFKKHLKKLFIVVVFCIIGNYTYDKFIRIGFDVVQINIDNFCKKQAIKTRFIISFLDRDVTIFDPLQKVKKIFIFKSDIKKIKVSVKKYIRIVSIESGVILKTENDSIDVGYNSEKLHGYMGVWEKNNCYDVNQNGTFVRCDRIYNFLVPQL